LCATYHQKPDYFLWEIGERAAVELLTKAPPPPGVPASADKGLDGFADFHAVVNGIIKRFKEAAK
jgi:hypothetical protein